MRVRSQIIGFLIVGAGAAAITGSARASAAEAEMTDWSIERLDDSVELPAQGALSIVNLHGDLRLRAGEPGQLRLHAVVQRHREDPRRASLDLNRSADGLVASALFGSASREARPEWDRRRIDVAVELPPDRAVSVRTADGLVEVKGHAAALEIASESGAIRLQASGPISARSERGPILAMLRGGSWARASSFSTSTGPIEVHFPARSDVDVELETRGRLTTDVSLVVDRITSELKRARARLGGGGERVSLKSERGDLRIAIQPPPPKGNAPGGKAK